MPFNFFTSYGRVCAVVELFERIQLFIQGISELQYTEYTEFYIELEFLLMPGIEFKEKMMCWQGRAAHQ